MQNNSGENNMLDLTTYGLFGNINFKPRNKSIPAPLTRFLMFKNDISSQTPVVPDPNDKTKYSLTIAAGGRYIGAYISNNGTIDRARAATWQTSDPTVAPVPSTPNGQSFNTLSKGTATITASQDGLTSTLFLTVT